MPLTSSVASLLPFVAAAVLCGACGSSASPSENSVAGAPSNGGSPGSGGATTSLGGGGGAHSTGGTSGKTGSGGTSGNSGSGGSTSSGGTSSGGTTGSGGAVSYAGSPGACGEPNGNPGTPTALVPGKWTNVTPPGVDMAGGGGVLCVAIDPSNASVLYIGIEAKIGGSPNNGVWKTTDGGGTWRRLGSGKDDNPYDGTSNYLDLPLTILVDPHDAKHLYLAEGVRGADNGFWVSTDGGDNWTRPAGFPPAGTTTDVTMMAVDPCDFSHILLSSHSDWGSTAGYSGGVMESTDGGQTWIAHPPPNDAWSAGTHGVMFLKHPRTGTGNANTWLVSDEGGFWRTTNAGTNWTKVSDASTPHGTNQFDYTNDGVLYAGAVQYPRKSTDNGVTWQTLTTGLPYQVYYAVANDGTTLYTMPDGYPPGAGYLTSKDGLAWTPYSDTTKPNRGPIHLKFDPVNRVLYSANWDAGFWALKLK